MKAAVVPAANSSWQIKDVPQPQPGTNQVREKMHASGICYTDVHMTLGHFPVYIRRFWLGRAVGSGKAHLSGKPRAKNQEPSYKYTSWWSGHSVLAAS